LSDDASHIPSSPRRVTGMATERRRHRPGMRAEQASGVANMTTTPGTGLEGANPGLQLALV
jgi:hypothetical protein